jgi:hypothetical protein
MAEYVGTEHLLLLQFRPLTISRLPDPVRAYADPTTISVLVTPPTGAPSTLTLAGGEVIKIKTGVFYAVILSTAAGRWKAVTTSTGAAAGVDVDEWDAVVP